MKFTSAMTYSSSQSEAAIPVRAERVRHISFQWGGREKKISSKKKSIGKAMSLYISLYAMKEYSCRRSIAAHNLGTRYRCVVNFTLRPLYSRNRTPASTNRRVGGPHGRIARPEQDSNPGSSIL